MQWRGPWLIVSILFVLAIVLSYIFPYKPRFVVPGNRIHLIISYIAILLLAIIPLNIRISTGWSENTTQSIPIQILFDVSLSMTANDLLPSRFAVAKDMVDELISSWDNYPVSIILFSGIPFVHIPFSTDTQAILSKWETTQLGQFPPVPQFVWTSIWDALLLGVQNMENNGFGTGIIILITDGDSNKWYEPDDVITILEKKRIPLFALWIGKTDAFTVGYDIFSNPVYTTYNPIFLNNLTKKVWWQTFVAETTDDIQSIIISLERQVSKNVYTVNEPSFFLLNDIFIPLIFIRTLYVTGIRSRIRYTNK